MASRTMVVLLFVYGFGLCAFAFVFGGAGRGIFGPLGLAGSPFSLVGYRSSMGFEPAFAAAALQWGLLGLAARWFRLQRTWVIVFLIVHYAVAAFLLCAPWSPYGYWEYLDEISRSSWFLVAIGISWYLAGQALLWRVIVRREAGKVRVGDEVRE